ncbi:MAG: hypothetical protein K6E63_06605 [Lachnospiraceae bacterium]|nr:hypothetical protein [Lachnospiraceae bacterium]
MMNSKLFYRALSGVYDLLDVIYFRDELHSPRTAVLKKKMGHAICVIRFFMYYYLLYER